MPRQERRVPRGMNRFNYWTFEVAGLTIEEEDVHARYCADEDSSYCPREFRALRDGTSQEPAQVLANRRKSLWSRFGSIVDDSRILALAWYAWSDKRWQQDSEAWDLFRQLPVEARSKIGTIDHLKWRYRGAWDWDDLLSTIATDQVLFEEMLMLGPTESGLVWTRRSVAEQEFPWVRRGYARSSAKRVYDGYQRQVSVLFGEGFRPPKDWENALRAEGLMDEKGRVLFEPLMEGLKGKPRKEKRRYTGPVLHWFAHGLNNLRLYRNGKPPIPWHSDACAAACLDVRKRLARSF